MSKALQKVDKPLLRLVNEKSNGGFIMFTFGDNGYPVVNSHFDDASKAMALQHYIQNWSLAVDAVTLENTVAHMEMELEEDIFEDAPPQGDEDGGYEDSGHEDDDEEDEGGPFDDSDENS
jgi:hypothetical protein|tara:strand:+ start:859 stop:1218 length:360 start_codon:yes stop_codon:yes gene_type:complete